MKQGSLILIGLAVLGVGATIYERTRNGLEGVKLPGPSAVFSPVQLADLTLQEKARYAAATDVVRQAFLLEIGRNPNDAELQYTTAIADVETSFGQGWKGAMKGSNNWGAVQCSANAQQAAGCIPYQDSFSNGEKYSIAFRSYASPVDGARDVVKHVVKVRPRTAAVLAAGGTIYEASLAMRRESYYGGFCPKATARYSASAIVAKENRNPVSDAARACEAEAVELHAKRVAGVIAKVAAAAGLKPMALGDYVSALEGWKSNAVAGPTIVRGDAWGVLSIFDEPTTLRDELPW